MALMVFYYLNFILARYMTALQTFALTGYCKIVVQFSMISYVLDYFVLWWINCYVTVTVTV